MINRIAEELAYHIKENTFWVDKCVGIVTPITYKVSGQDKTIPVYFNLKRDLCNGGDYIDLVPDSSKTSVVYMEIASEPSVVSVKQNGTRFNSSLDLVVWLNYQKINLGMVDTDILVANIIENIPSRIANNEYVGVGIKVTSVSTKDRFVFNKYTYNNDIQFLMYPYDFFSIRMEVEYTIPKGCAVLTENTEACNLKPIIMTVGKDKVEIGVIRQ